MAGIERIDSIRDGADRDEAARALSALEKQAAPFISEIMRAIKGDPQADSWQVDVFHSLKYSPRVAEYLEEKFAESGYHIQWSDSSGFSPQTKFVISLSE